MIIKLSAFNTRLDSLLQGIETDQLADGDRDLCVREAVRGYGRDLPREAVTLFAGAANSYYLLYGKAIAIAESSRDAYIALKSSGADSQLAVLITLERAMRVQQVNLFLSRVGATVNGTLQAHLYSTSSSLPDQLMASSLVVDLDGVEGAPRGRYAQVLFPFSAEDQFDLPAGTYAVALAGIGYTYGAGTSELRLGVDQSSVTNTVCTYNGAAWSAYGTDSAGMIEVIASTPGWAEDGGAVTQVEYPAASISAGEEPIFLEDEDFRVFEAESGTYLYLPNHQPPTTENLRLTLHSPYAWVEGDDPQIDLPGVHFEAVCNLAAAEACMRLATRYGQNRESTLAADSVERRTQADVYMSLAKRFREGYGRLLGQGAEAPRRAGMAVVDMDLGSGGRDFIFHRRGSR